MGIYIKDMEMPKGRPVCVVIDAAGQARHYDLNNDRYADDNLFEAIPVPPHGRLIDADALCMKLKMMYAKAFGEGNTAYHAAYRSLERVVNHEPTIIEAGKETENEHK